MSRLFLCLILCATPAYAAEATAPAASSQPATSQPANDFERIAQQTVDILDAATANLAPVKDEATAREAAAKLTALKKDVDGMKESIAKLGTPNQDVQAAAMDKYAKRIEASYLRLAAQQMRVRSDPKLDAIVGKPLDELGLIPGGNDCDNNSRVVIDLEQSLERIRDPLIRAGVTAAIEKTLLPAATEHAYPGHFNVVADGSHYGGDSTWPGLDSWEMAGAYLLLGREQLVRDYFDFVRASQRPDGNIPFAIMPADTPPEGMDSYGRGLRYPQDVYEHLGRKWIGLFHHWQVRVNPLSVLAPICYILTAYELSGFDDDHVDSVAAAGRYLLSRKSGNGLIGGAGFYIECPPRDQWDGTTQCFAVAALSALAILTREDRWRWEADALAERFREIYWRANHFAEYVHPERGVIDSHGLSDVNWAAIAFDVATQEQKELAWARMTAEKLLWHGGMPTQLVSRPKSYESWEYPEPLPFEHVNGPVYDAAAMGRVWHLEALACARMKDWDRLRKSARLVCAMGERNDWQWYERYHALDDGSVRFAGPRGYCEYAAILVRIVLGNLGVFT